MYHHVLYIVLGLEMSGMYVNILGPENNTETVKIHDVTKICSLFAEEAQDNEVCYVLFLINLTKNCCFCNTNNNNHNQQSTIKISSYFVCIDTRNNKIFLC